MTKVIAADDDKYLFELRKEFISEKGKGMWEEMKAKYSEKHQGNWEKAALQMKVSRAVAKFGVWPKREVSHLCDVLDGLSVANMASCCRWSVSWKPTSTTRKSGTSSSSPA